MIRTIGQRTIENLNSQISRLQARNLALGAMRSASQIAGAGQHKLNDGYQHPKIGYGTYKVGYIPASAAGSGGKSTGDGSEATDCVRAALDVGYRLFDCAQFYGNEKFVAVGNFGAKYKLNEVNSLIINQLFEKNEMN